MEFLPECEIKEECGVFGIFNPDGGDVAPSIYYGLSSLQHRGQESCGIAVCDTNRFASESSRSKTEWRPPSTVNCTYCSMGTLQLWLSGFHPWMQLRDPLLFFAFIT